MIVLSTLTLMAIPANAFIAVVLLVSDAPTFIKVMGVLFLLIDTMACVCLAQKILDTKEPQF